MSETLARLGFKDYALLSLFCLVLFSFPLFNNRVLTTHETVHCQNVREMMQGGDWIIPHYGGRVWMERPPLPFWISAAFVHVFGDNAAAYRLPPLVLGCWCVLLVGWMASVWYGRVIGLASGLILATMREFTHYSTGAEADMFLCAIVTTALALFVYLQFVRRNLDSESSGFISGRPWPVLAFFLVLGLTNLAKGLFFGSLFVCLPIGAFLLWNANWRALRRYIWLPGWLAYLAVGSTWALAAYFQYPGVIEFWQHDYGGRLNQGYMREPFWYYLAQWPLVVFPWPILVVAGFVATKQDAFTSSSSASSASASRASAARFLWCWGLVPILFFSIPQGKHHHYLLQTMAPWAVLGALGGARLWQMMVASRRRTYVEANYLRGVAIVSLLLIGVHWGTYALRTAYWDRYKEDSQFLKETASVVPAGQRVWVMDDDAPLNASWLLYYLDGRATLLHNITFLRSGDIHASEIFLIARAKQEAALSDYGTFDTILHSEHSRYENGPEDRYALYRLHFHPELKRVPGPVPISPLQATGRAFGPYLQ
jgi:4-amino-4-deoxy-L-arabinose transferase-like glycosyltransferase